MDKVGANTMNLDLKVNDVERGIYLYVLVLQNDKFYVGITNSPEKRFKKHRSGKSIKFINENLPIIDIRKILLATTDRYEALRIETKTTILLIQDYGIENVCGGAILGDVDDRISKLKIYYKKLKSCGYFNPPIKSKPDLRTRKDQGKCSAAGATQNRLD